MGLQFEHVAFTMMKEMRFTKDTTLTKLNHKIIFKKKTLPIYSSIHPFFITQNKCHIVNSIQYSTI